MDSKYCKLLKKLEKYIDCSFSDDATKLINLKNDVHDFEFGIQIICIKLMDYLNKMNFNFNLFDKIEIVTTKLFCELESLNYQLKNQKIQKDTLAKKINGINEQQIIYWGMNIFSNDAVLNKETFIKILQNEIMKHEYDNLEDKITNIENKIYDINTRLQYYSGLKNEMSVNKILKKKLENLINKLKNFKIDICQDKIIDAEIETICHELNDISIKSLVDSINKMNELCHSFYCMNL